MTDYTVSAHIDALHQTIQKRQPTLRDQFAMAAPEPDKSDIWYEFVKVEGNRGGEQSPIPDAQKLRVACKLRYKYADAMLEARR